MLFCLTAEYTPQALNAMRENPNTDRRAAAEELLAAAGGKLIAMYGKATNGPGAMVIFDVPDPAMAPAMCGVAVSSGSLQNVELTASLRWRRLPAFGKRRGRFTALTSHRVSGKSARGRQTTVPDFWAFKPRRVLSPVSRGRS
jgi:uncharacterized protein with GYD domain